MRDRIELGRAIRVARVALGMTQLELSANVRLSRPAIANIEAGRQAMPVDNLLADLAGQQRSISDTLHEAAQLIITLAKESESMVATLRTLGAGSTPPDEPVVMAGPECFRAHRQNVSHVADPLPMPPTEEGADHG